MLLKKQITENLTVLETSFRSAATAREAAFFAKLSILELCGWIEQTMDHVIRRCAKRVKRKDCIKAIESEIRRTYGFDYQDHFRSTLCFVVGMVNFELIEQHVDPQRNATLQADLANLKRRRDGFAHTYLEVLPQIDAPSVNLTRLNNIYAGLYDIEQAARYLGF
jgi:hypothetical protein